jgi:hypothetical protein
MKRVLWLGLIFTFFTNAFAATNFVHRWCRADGASTICGPDYPGPCPLGPINNPTGQTCNENGKIGSGNSGPKNFNSTKNQKSK